MASESEIMHEIRLRIGGRKDCRLWRNHVWSGEDKFGRFHKTGKPKGSSDLDGWIVIRGVPVPLYVEVKTPTGRLSKDQAEWLDFVNEWGGIAFVATSAENAEQQLNELTAAHRIWTLPN